MILGALLVAFVGGAGKVAADDELRENVSRVIGEGLDTAIWILESMKFDASKHAENLRDVAGVNTWVEWHEFSHFPTDDKYLHIAQSTLDGLVEFLNKRGLAKAGQKRKREQKEQKEHLDSLRRRLISARNSVLFALLDGEVGDLNQKDRFIEDFREHASEFDKITKARLIEGTPTETPPAEVKASKNEETAQGVGEGSGDAPGQGSEDAPGQGSGDAPGQGSGDAPGEAADKLKKEEEKEKKTIITMRMKQKEVVDRYLEYWNWKAAAAESGKHNNPAHACFHAVLSFSQRFVTTLEPFEKDSEVQGDLELLPIEFKKKWKVSPLLTKHLKRSRDEISLNSKTPDLKKILKALSNEMALLVKTKPVSLDVLLQSWTSFTTAVEPHLAVLSGSASGGDESVDYTITDIVAVALLLPTMSHPTLERVAAALRLRILFRYWTKVLVAGSLQPVPTSSSQPSAVPTSSLQPVPTSGFQPDPTSSSEPSAVPSSSHDTFLHDYLDQCARKCGSAV